eukprot:TRINITY_DN9891_c6_g1_i1.p1 TRINITY_DN9891_c6_g1~~TRINITY_DN9891_c6_g1_i1.p1  ORF type:complete len:911 (+),score=256.41 TRINITY_DN9891_c6_g1_i1:109-2841(+)
MTDAIEEVVAWDGSRETSKDARDKSSARWKLRRAFQSRRVAELEVALMQAEEAGLYAMELKQARATLSDARKVNAQAQLNAAVQEENIEAIEAAILQAQKVGLSQQRLETAANALEAEKRRADARVVLKQGLRTRKLETMQEALVEAEIMGLRDFELAHARSLILRESIKEAARETLQDAIDSQSVPGLQGALAETANAGLTVKDTEAARKAIEVEKTKIEARLIVKDAIVRKRRSDEDQLEDLQSAVKLGESAGLSAKDMEKVRHTLDHDMRKVEALHCLKEAAEKGTEDALKPAIKMAEDAGIDEDRLAPFKNALTESYKPTARLKLKEAVESRNIDAIEKAIEYGQAVGLTSLAFDEAKKVLSEEYRKIDARMSLDAKAKIPNNNSKNLINELKAALKFAELAGLLEHEMEASRLRIEDLDSKYKAREGVAAAITAGKCNLLRVAIKSGHDAGLEPHEIVPAEKALEETLKAFVRSALEEVVTYANAALIYKGKQREEIKIKEASTALVAALGVVSGNDDDEGDAESSKKTEELERAAAEQGGRRNSRRMSAATFGRKNSDLKAEAQTLEMLTGGGEDYDHRIKLVEQVLQLCETVCLDDSETRLANEVKAGLGVKLKAMQAMCHARHLQSLMMVNEALAEAKAADLTYTEMRETMEAQRVYQLREEAEEKLEEAVESREIAALKTAIKRAKAAELDADDIEEAEEILVVEEKFEALRDVLRQACGSVFDLKKAIAHAEENELPQDDEVLLEHKEALSELLKRNANKALAEAVKNRKLDSLNRALRLAMGANLGDDEALVKEVKRARAEGMVLEGLAIPATHRLTIAVKEAEIWCPDFEHLAEARTVLAAEKARDNAREVLRGAVKGGDPVALGTAIRMARDAGLEDFEMKDAELCLHNHRQRLLIR